MSKKCIHFFGPLCIYTYIYIYIYLKEKIGIDWTCMGRYSSVSIATRYGLDGPVIEPRWGARFSAPVQTYSRSHPASYTVGTESLSLG